MTLTPLPTDTNPPESWLTFPIPERPDRDSQSMELTGAHAASMVIADVFAGTLGSNGYSTVIDSCRASVSQTGITSPPFNSMTSVTCAARVSIDRMSVTRIGPCAVGRNGCGSDEAPVVGLNVPNRSENAIGILRANI